MSEQVCVQPGPPKAVRHVFPMRSRAAHGTRGREGPRDWRPLWLASPVVVAVTVAAGLGLWSPRTDESSDTRTLAPQGNAAPASSPARPGTRQPQALRDFQQAQAARQQRHPDSNASARQLYEAAIRQDPAFARAYAGLAMTYALQQQHGWAAESDGVVPLQRAADMAANAIRLQPDLPEAHWAVAYVETLQRRHADALRELDESLRLDPRYADALALQSAIHLYIGEPARALGLAQQALRLNHDATSLYLLLLGRTYYFLGDMNQARQYVGQSLQRNPENLEARLYMAAAEQEAGHDDAAQWQVTEILQLDPELRADEWLANYPLVDPASRERLRKALLAVGL